MVSCYLRLDPAARKNRAFLVELLNRIRRLEMTFEVRGLSVKQVDQVKSDLERIVRWLAAPANLPRTPGIALFASSPHRLFEAIRLAKLTAPGRGEHHFNLRLEHERHRQTPVGTGAPRGGRYCPGQGDPIQAPNLVDRVIEEALRQQVEVVVIDDPNVAARVGGPAATLRFRSIGRS